MSTKGLTGITNLYLYNRYLNDVEDAPSTDINDTESLRYIIDDTCDLIAKKCGRVFGSTEYKERVRGESTPYLVLNNYPITKIKLVSTSDIDLAYIKGTGFSLATLRSNNSSLVLTSIATDGATETESTFNYSTYANVSSLVTAVDAITGWDAEVLSNNDSAISELIRPIDSGWCLDEQVYIRGPYLGNSVRIMHDSDCTIESLGGGSFIGDIFVWYVAGYTLPVCDDQGGNSTVDGNVPKGLTLIANTIISEVLSYRDEDGNMAEEKQGDYGYVRGVISSCIDRHWKDLSLYSRKSV